MQVKPTTREEYLKRINRLTEYINANLQEELDLISLAERCMLSPYHFHRIMKAFLGEPLGAYINRLRVENAVRSLRYSNASIQDIAYSVGYSSPASFTKVFKQYYGFSPSEFRNNKNLVIMKQDRKKSEINLKGPKIQEVPEKTTLYIAVTGKYSELDFGGCWGKLWGCVKEQQLFAKGVEHICVYHDDPQITETDKLRTDIS